MKVLSLSLLCFGALSALVADEPRPDPFMVPGYDNAESVAEPPDARRGPPEPRRRGEGEFHSEKRIDGGEFDGQSMRVIEQLLNTPPEELAAIRAAIERIEQMSPEEKKAALERIEAFRKLDRSKRRQFIEQVRQVPPQTRRLMARYWMSLTPEEARETRDRLRAMSPEERHQFRNELIERLEREDEARAEADAGAGQE